METDSLNIPRATAQGLSPAVLALIGANLMPLLGVLVLDWDLFTVMFLFWLENAVIGLYNALKVLFFCTFESFFVMLLFLVHYGFYMAIHLQFILVLFSPEKSVSFFPWALMTSHIMTVWPALICFFLSHGVSFFYNFLGKQEFLHTEPEEQMTAPYKRVVIMHATIIFGGLVIVLLAIPVVALVLLVVLKIVSDVRAHQKEHAVLWQSIQ